MLATKVICTLRKYYYSVVNRLSLYRKARWSFTLLLVIAYIQTMRELSFDVATYLIGFYLLQLLLSYYTPKGLVEQPQEDGDQGLSDEIVQENNYVLVQAAERDLQYSNDKPLVRQMGQKQIWERTTFAFLMGTVCSYFKMLDIDVFWPMLLIYFVILVCYTVQKILAKMEKYRYRSQDFQKNAIFATL